MQSGHASEWLVTLIPCTTTYALFFVLSFAHYVLLIVWNLWLWHHRDG